MPRFAACAMLATWLALAGSPGSAADWKREATPDGAWKEEYDDGNCKIERKRDKDGSYQEKVDCKRGPSSRPAVFYVPRR